jgi:crotonobetainyl-CoA:carnitine CoA-transferase CaiB-like acyl-CoA transferase
MPSAFEGIRVLDLAQGVAGPYAAMLLAEQGAEVLKVEPPERDRLHGSAAYHVLNRGKRILLAGLHGDDGRATLTALLLGADVVIVDLPESEARAAGLDHAGLAHRHPRLIYLALPPYGGGGPMADERGDEALVAAYAGIAGSQWSGGEQPVDLVLPLAGYGAALLGAGAVAAALYERARSGKGQRVEVSWLAGAFALQSGSLLKGAGVERLGGTTMNPLGPVPVYRLYRAADGGWLFIAAGTPRFFQRLCILLDHPEWISDPRWENAPWGIIDLDDRQALADEIAPIIATRPRDEWLPLLTEADIPNAAVSTREEFIESAQVQALGLRTTLHDPEAGDTVQMGTPLLLHGTPGPGPRPPARTTDAAWEGPAQRSSGQRGPQSSAAAGPHPPAPSPNAGRGGAEGPHPAASSPTAGRVGAEGPHPVAPSPTAGRGGDVTGAGPLAGVRVLDLSGFIAGSYCPMTLADMGADVIKVETPEGDAFRTFGFGFLGWNRGKRGLSVDPRTDEGRAVIHDLVRGADVLVENLRPGAAARIGLDYDTLAAINPRLIYSTVTAFGSIGPDAQLPGFDPLLQARSGVMAAQGGMEGGHPPVYLTVAVCDYAAALLAVYGICAALAVRESTGLGQHVESSLVHSSMAIQAGEFIWYQGRPPLARGGVARIGATAGDRLYQTADGWLRLGLRDPSLWPALTAAVGDAALTAMTAESAVMGRVDGEVAQALAAAFRARPLAEWLAILRAAGVPAAAVLRPADLFTDAQVLAEDLIAEHVHPVWGPLRQSGVLAKFARTPGTAQRVAPLLGEHSRAVLAEIGYDIGRIDDLIARRIVVETHAEQ